MSGKCQPATLHSLEYLVASQFGIINHCCSGLFIFSDDYSSNCIYYYFIVSILVVFLAQILRASITGALSYDILYAVKNPLITKNLVRFIR